MFLCAVHGVGRRQHQTVGTAAGPPPPDPCAAARARRRGGLSSTRSRRSRVLSTSRVHRPSTEANHYPATPQLLLEPQDSPPAAILTTRQPVSWLQLLSKSVTKRNPKSSSVLTSGKVIS